MQNGYEPLRVDYATADDSVKDGTTANLTFQHVDMPSTVKQVGPEANICEMLFEGAGSENDTFSFKLYSYSVNGPAEIICAGNGILGTAKYDNDHLYCDTVTFTEQTNWLDTPVTVDSGNNRICRVCTDLFGTRFIDIEFTNVGGGGTEASEIRAHIRFL
jgi:hypothetical protein